MKDIYLLNYSVKGNKDVGPVDYVIFFYKKQFLKS